MNEQDKKEMRQIFNEGFEQLVLPNFDRIDKKLDQHTKILNEHTKILDYHTQDLDHIERKLDAEISWRDNASKRLKNLEITTGIIK